MRGSNRATAVAFVALFVAIGGSATAAKLISGKQIKNGSITKKDLSSSTVKSLRGAQGPQGVAGTPGAAGLPGVAGAAGAPGPVGMTKIVIAQGTKTLCSGTSQCSIDSVEAVCPTGTKAFGGGVSTAAIGGTFIGSITKTTGYIVAANNYGSSSTAELNAFAYCSKDVTSITFPNGNQARGTSDDQVERTVRARFEAEQAG